MYNSEDTKRENKIKYAKNETLRNTVLNYLQKRNYKLLNTVDVSKSELQTYSSVENEISNPNSVLYRCYNCDPVIIDNNFSKFVIWIKELDVDVTDLEQLIGPLFCHLYLDILQGGHPEKAAAFFLSHLASVEKVNQNTFIQDLMKTLSAENGSDYLTQEFRSNKYIIQLKEHSKQQLMNFVMKNCHIIILQELQTWFDIQVMSDDIVEMEHDLIPNECCLNSKFQEIINASADLENINSKIIFSVGVSNVISEINCGLLSRYHGWFIYNQNNLVYVNTLHNFNSLSEVENAESVRLNGHSTKVYAMTSSKNYLVTGSSDGKICIYLNENFEIIKECLGHTRTIYCLRISSNEFYLASGSEDNTVRLWDTSNGHFLRIFVGHHQAVVSLDFHPNCLYLISGSCDKTIRLWKIDNAAPIRLLHESEGTIRCLSCHPQGKILVSASDDQYIRAWDILNGKIISELRCREGYCKHLQWSKDGNLLCGSFSDGSVRIWNVKIQENSVNFVVMQVISNTNNIIAIEYCFGTFGILTTK